MQLFRSRPMGQSQLRTALQKRDQVHRPVSYGIAVINLQDSLECHSLGYRTPLWLQRLTFASGSVDALNGIVEDHVIAIVLYNLIRVSDTESTLLSKISRRLCPSASA